MARTPRKQITWKVDRKVDSPPRHRPYYPDIPIDEALRETYERCLVPGAMFFLRTRLCIVPDTTLFAPEPHPYVYESLYGGDAVAGNKGNVAIYAGQVRVEESTGKSLIRVPRHSFIINGGRYLLSNLNMLEPVTSVPPGVS